MGFFLPTETGTSFGGPPFSLWFQPLVMVPPDAGRPICWSTVSAAVTADLLNQIAVFAFSHGSAQVRSLTWVP